MAQFEVSFNDATQQFGVVITGIGPQGPAGPAGKDAELEPTGVEAGTYGGVNASSVPTNLMWNIPNVTVDEYGRITDVSNTVLAASSIAGGAIFSRYTNGNGYQPTRDTVYNATFNTNQLRKINVKPYGESAYVSLPVILGAWVYIYINEEKTKRAWIPAEQYSYISTDSKGYEYCYVGLKMPEEYFDYNWSAEQYTANFSYVIMYESSSPTLQM